MDIIQLYQDYGVPFLTEGHKHTRPGWVNTECPFCTGNPGYHLGYDIEGDKFVCWRCGGKYTPKVISALLNIPLRQSYTILSRYGVLVGTTTIVKRKMGTKPFKLPASASNVLTNKQEQYIISRNFDPEKLVNEYQIYGAGPFANIDNISYKHRIIIPYIWDGQIISFDSRAISNNVQNKYMACAEAREITPRKSILYGRQDKWKRKGVIVEGPTDVWRLGFSAAATSGIKYTPAQLRLIAKTFPEGVFILFDPEKQAQVQAQKLIGDLNFRGVPAFNINIKSDPGDLSPKEAKYLLKQLKL